MKNRRSYGKAFRKQAVNHSLSLLCANLISLTSPHDPRMWIALGNCFESIDRDNQARDCYKRASLCENDDKDTAWIRLARIFQKTGNLDAAATYFKQVLEMNEQDKVSKAEYPFCWGN